MYGISALLIVLMFAVVAFGFFAGLYLEWKNRPQEKRVRPKLIGITAFIFLWFALIASTYVRRAMFCYELWNLRATDVYLIEIGRHQFRDHATIEDIVGALRRSRWFEVNHGGWGDSVPLTLRRRAGGDMAIDVALYFREPGAIVGAANPRGLGYSVTETFVPELPSALERHSVKLPNCDTAHGRPCTPQQLNP